MTHSPMTIAAAVAENGEFRAGATDVSERRRTGVSSGRLVDIGRIPNLDHIEWTADGAARIGALVKIATIAADGRVGAAYPGLAAAAGGLATPQIRAVGTLGGNLAQRTRCWYYRSPEVGCFKKGGDTCPARHGNHLYGVSVDLGPCVWPHPSTLAVALLAYDARIEVAGRDHSDARPVAGLFHGADPHRDIQLAEGELVTRAVLSRPLEGERAAYFRAISRTYAEWPLIEAVVRLVLDDGVVRFAAVAIGGVANIPLRVTNVEDMLVGRPLDDQTIHLAAHASGLSHTLPQTGYKADLLPATLIETINRAAG